MTKEDLKQYRSRKKEIPELYEKLRESREDDSLIGSDVIMDYRSGYPRPQSIVAVDRERQYQREQTYRETIELRQQQCAEVEEFIEAIKDSQDRRMFRLHYIDGLKQHEVGEAIGFERSNVSKRLDKYL